MVLAKTQQKLLEWYRLNARALPWRTNRDPYRIWISETMLQQTTTTAVIPFFERFLDQFPTLESLASAPVGGVVEAWVGLGYYSRARNLHKSAQALVARGGFPKTFEALAEFPGFGPYTSRSVASLAFDQACGVVDGNVIRVLARAEAHDWDWWQAKTRALVQERADAWVNGVSSYEMNQALMELGRTICMPKSPTCLLCPLQGSCLSLKRGEVDLRPRPKPRRARELWEWHAIIDIRENQILLRKNASVPFLRGQYLVPGVARRLLKKPKVFDYRHSITHHDIYVSVKAGCEAEDPTDLWVPLQEIRQYVPASLVQKAISHVAPRGSTQPLRLPTAARREKQPSGRPARS